MSHQSHRPHVMLIWASIFSAIIVVGCLVGWVALGAEVRARFTWFQLITLIVLAGIGIGIMMSMGLSTVRTSDRGIWIRNALLTREYAWDQVADIRFGTNDPWAYLILAENPEDPQRIALLALQSVDGERTRTAVAQLRAELTHVRP